MDPIQFGPFQTNLGTAEKDNVTVPAGESYYTGPGNDLLICGSEPVFDDEFENGGFVTRSVLMSGGQDNDNYKFGSSDYQWATIADSSGGRDRIKMPRKHPFNPKTNDSSARVDLLLVSNRDVVLIHTDLNDGGRYYGLTFFDPFGRLDQNNKIEKILFGNKAKSKGNKHSFSEFYTAIRDNAAGEQSGTQYSFSEATYEQLGASGLLNLEGIDNVSALDDGSAIQVAAFNNSLIS